MNQQRTIMSMQQVPQSAFEIAGVKPVCGFDFLYDPKDAHYGICVRTDGTLPQISNVVEAGRVGQELQRVLFQSPAQQVTLLHPA
jgi:hypothetical protein